ncbi:MAG: response regulator [Candidatus Methanomethyliales bacterium]|nr:response regulator [Candidatus Methanomethylicales archaeon]
MEERAKILVIDDDEYILESVKEILSQVGYLVHTTKNGQEALTKLNDSFYNLLLVDIVLPDIDGLDLIERLTDTLPKMRKVVITGYASLENALRALSLGANAFIMKPISPKDLLGVVEKELKLQREELKDLQECMAEYIRNKAKKYEK